MKSLLDEISQFSKSKLKPTETIVSYPNGAHFLVNSRTNEQKEVIMNENEEMSNSTNGIVYWSRNLGYLVDLVPDNSIDEIVPRLFLSGDDVAMNRNILKEKNITHVINLTSNVKNMFEPQLIYKKIIIYDLPTQPIEKYFDEACQFIDEALKYENNRVLVHCNAGISRSSTIVIAYLMTKGIFKTYKEAFDHVKSKRAKICPNEGFVRRLKCLETQKKNP